MAAPSLRGRLRTLFPRSDGESAEEPDDGRSSLALGLSFLVALVLWFTFSMQETYTTTINVPLEIAGLPEGQALLTPPPATARVSVQGEGEALLSLSWSPPRVRLFADGPTVDVAASVAESGLPAGVTVLGTQPRSIRLDLDRSATKDLPIRISGQVRAADQYDLIEAPVLNPATVRVSGAAALLDQMEFWPTVPYDREELREDITVSLALSDTLAGLVTRSVEMTTMTVAVGEFTTGEMEIPVEVINLPPGIETVRFEPGRVVATFRAQIGEALSRVEQVGFRAVVDYADIARDTTSGSVTIGVQKPAGIDARGVRLEPSRVEYFLVRKAPAQTVGE